jgi:hypothetical protein
MFPAHRVELFRTKTCVYQTKDHMPNFRIVLLCDRKELPFLFRCDDMVPVILSGKLLNGTDRINHIPFDGKVQSASDHANGAVHV